MIEWHDDVILALLTMALRRGAVLRYEPTTNSFQMEWDGTFYGGRNLNELVQAMG